MSGRVSLGERIDQIRAEIDLMEAVYTRAKQRVTGNDPEWEERKKLLIRQMADLLSRYKIGDEPHKAVGIVAQASLMANELRAPDSIVAQYDEKVAILRLAQQDFDRIQESKRRAEEATSRHYGTRRAVGS